MAAGAPRITSEYLASGTEGCIVGPALPNLSENGSTWEEYPDNVTKLYKNRDKYNKAQTNTRKIVDLLHNNSHRVYPYRYKGYMGLNISKTMRKSCELNRNMPLLPLRMKNLGVSIADLSENRDGSLNKTKTVPFGVIIDSIYRIYKQLKSLFDNGYIHGDVRQTNIMIHPNTGKITLIDFGWLYPIDTFFMEYNDALGFYSNPPESLLYSFMVDRQYSPKYKYLSYILDPRITEGTIRRTIRTDFVKGDTIPVNNKIEAYQYFSKGVGNKIEDAELQAALTSAALYFKGHIAVADPRDYLSEFQQYCRMMAPSFDLYGLSFTIHLLIRSVYNDLSTITKNGTPYTEEERVLIRTTIEELVRDVIRPGMALDISTRIPIGEACWRLEPIMTSYHDRLNGMTGGRRRRKTHKRRSGGRKTLRRK
jgi:hypothetical protein